MLNTYTRQGETRRDGNPRHSPTGTLRAYLDIPFNIDPKRQAVVVVIISVFRQEGLILCLVKACVYQDPMRLLLGRGGTGRLGTRIAGLGKGRENKMRHHYHESYGLSAPQSRYGVSISKKRCVLSSVILKPQTRAISHILHALGHAISGVAVRDGSWNGGTDVEKSRKEPKIVPPLSWRVVFSFLSSTSQLVSIYIEPAEFALRIN